MTASAAKSACSAGTSVCVQGKEGWPVKLRDPFGAKVVLGWDKCLRTKVLASHSPGQAVFRYGEMRPKGLKGLSVCR